MSWLGSISAKSSQSGGDGEVTCSHRTGFKTQVTQTNNHVEFSVPSTSNGCLGTGRLDFSGQLSGTTVTGTFQRTYGLCALQGSASGTARYNTIGTGEISGLSINGSLHGSCKAVSIVIELPY